MLKGKVQKMKPPSYKAYPRHIVIYKNIWDVKFSRGLIDGCDLGQCDEALELLEISLKQKNRKELLKTFIHEVLHGIEKEYEIILGHDVINKLEDPLANLLLENF